MKKFYLRWSKMLFFENYVVEGNTEADAQKCFIKTSILKNVRKTHS